MKKAILALVLMGAFTVANATNGNNGNGNGGCGNGQQTNGCGTTAGSYGGQGGAGGQGGSGTGVGVSIAAAGAAASATGGSVGDIRNTNTAAGGSVIGSGNSSNDIKTNQTQTATGGKGGNAAATGGKASVGDTKTGDIGVEIGGDVYKAARIPVATAYAAPLAASNGTCFGSASGGVQVPGVGVSFGSTQFDENCDARYDSQELRAQGLVLAATARMCQKQANREAMEMAGTPCPNKKPAKTTDSITSANYGDSSGTNTYTGTDPIVRARLGLPPLK